MSKTLWILIGIFAIIIVVGAWGFWNMMQQPLYKPGQLPESISVPEQQDHPEYWQMQNRIDVYHFSKGQGPNLLFVHGGPGSPMERSTGAFDSLARDFTVQFYDQRGTGRSTRPFNTFEEGSFYEKTLHLESTLGIGAQLKDIERIRLILGEEQLILIGHSYGGFLASLYACEFPENVRALVLISPADLIVFPQKDGGLFESVRKLLPESQQEAFSTFLDEYLNFKKIYDKSEIELVAMNNQFAEYYSLAGQSKGLHMPENVAAEIGGWMVFANYFSMGRKHDYTDALENIDVPALIIHGDKDLQDISVSENYSKLITDSSLEIISGAGHFSHLEKPDKLANIVREFLKTIK